MLSFKENNSLFTINLFGGPGCGKSVTASRLFTQFKIDGKRVEYVSEVAKDMTWERRLHMLTEQDYIFAKQHNRIRRLVGQVEYAVCDSPIILGLMYMPDDFPKTFEPFIMEVFNSYNNINILLERNVPYDPNGRNQTPEEAVEIDHEMQLFLDTHNIEYTSIEPISYSDEQLYNLCCELVEAKRNQQQTHNTKGD